MEEVISFATPQNIQNTEKSNSALKMMLPIVLVIFLLLSAGGFFVLSQNIATLDKQLQEQIAHNAKLEELTQKVQKLEEETPEEKKLEIGVNELHSAFADALIKSFKTLDAGIVATQVETEKQAFIMQQLFAKMFTTEEQEKIIEEFLTRQKLKEKQDAQTPRDEIDWLGTKVKTTSETESKLLETVLKEESSSASTTEEKTDEEKTESEEKTETEKVSE